MTSTTKMKAMLMAAVAAMALSALGASSAVAATVAAKPSSSTIKLTTSGITLERNGGEVKSCNFSTTEQGGWIENTAQVYNESFGGTFLKCSEGKFLKMYVLADAYYNTVTGAYSFVMRGNGSAEISPTPWGGLFKQSSASGAWVNGSGLTPSQITFSETLIGYVGGLPITMTATLNATTTSNGLLTLSH